MGQFRCLPSEHKKVFKLSYLSPNMPRGSVLTPDQEAKVVSLLNRGYTLKAVQKELEKEGRNMTLMGISLVRKRFRTITDNAKSLEKMVTDKRINYKIETGEICDRSILIASKVIAMKIEDIFKNMQSGGKVSNYELYMMNSFMKTMASLSQESTPHFETTQSQIYQSLKEKYLKNEKDEKEEVTEAEVVVNDTFQEKNSPEPASDVQG